MSASDFDQVGRKTPAGGALIYLGQPNIFFVTVNTKDRVPWLGHSEIKCSLEAIWREQAKAWLVGYYLIMPDHLHLFCAPHDPRFGIDDWIKFWKSELKRKHLDHAYGWQPRAFHHRLRNRIEYEEKLAYVQANPIRKGLVKNAADWPLQGRIHDIRWTGD